MKKLKTLNVAACTIMMDAYRKSKQPEKSREIFQEMEVNSIKPHEKTLDILLSISGYNEIPLLLQSMKQKYQLIPNLFNYTTIFRIYIKANCFMDCVRILEEMKAQGLDWPGNILNSFRNIISMDIDVNNSVLYKFYI
jgi:pentatricopeptide repeat protein